jgi:ATP synthase I chain
VKLRTDDGVYARIIHRITWLIAGIGIAGSLVAGLTQGWRSAVGFCVGAALSCLSFWRWRRLTDALGDGPKGRQALGMVVRFFLLVAVAYGIIRYLGVAPAPVLVGLLTAGVAVVFALVLELF